MKRLYWRCMLRICWILEDAVDWWTDHNNNFYPSASWEDKLGLLNLGRG
jgi:hypothetical protein